MDNEQETMAQLSKHPKVEITSATAEETVVDHTLGTILITKVAAEVLEDTPETVDTVNIKTLPQLGLQVQVVVEPVVLKEVGLTIQAAVAVVSVSTEKVHLVLHTAKVVLEVQVVVVEHQVELVLVVSMWRNW